VLRTILTVAVALALFAWGVPPAAAQQQQQAPPEMPAPQAPDIEVGEQELSQFATALKQMQAVQRESRQEMDAIIQDEGLSEQRFTEILQSQRDEEAAEDSDIQAATEQEMQQFEQAKDRMIDVQRDTQSQMQQIVESEGLELQRFNRILAAVQQDPELQQRLQQLMAE
jgi:hypothetical protein